MASAKVVLAILIGCMVAGGGAIAVVSNGGDNDEQHVAYYKITGMEILDTCPYKEKSTQLLHNQLNKVGSGLFTPFSESDYKWMKITIQYELINSYLMFGTDFINQTPLVVKNYGATIQMTGYSLHCQFTDGYKEYEYFDHKEGSVDIWYLFPEFSGVSWDDVTLEDIGFRVSAFTDAIPMN